MIGWATLIDDVAMEAWTLVNAKNAGNATNHTADGAADNRANWTGSTLAFARPALNSARHTLRLRYCWNGDNGKDGGGSEKTAKHECLP